ncbi:bile acid:sodium symporter family protein [Bacillus massiliigorillae]|uniref:bile acid:sodium symporter family protein n=1 Tax=Bacillus massiliigorillae TaxID=1243664 RepID=UPI0003A0E170|nr:bile acid:sodium symporter [Bacillus massiliigorillae]
MKTLAEFFSKQLGLLILLVSIATYFSPVYWDAPSSVPRIFLGMVIFFTGLSMNTNALKEIRYKKKELAITVLMKWTITIIISVAIAHIFLSSHAELAAGLILTGAVPSATAATLYTFLAGGNISLVIAASLLDVVISPVVAPLAMIGLDTATISLSFISLLKSFLIIVIIPIVAGITLQRVFPQLPQHSGNVTKLLSPISLLIVIHTLMGNGKYYIAKEISLLPIILFAVLLQTIIPMIICYWIAKVVFQDEADARAALFQTSLCNSALAGILASEYFGGLGAVPAVINLIISLSIGAQIANRFTKKQTKLSKKAVA